MRRERRKRRLAQPNDQHGKSEPKAAPRPAWNKQFELIVNFEINHPEVRGGAVGALTSPSGSKTAKGSRCARWPLGCRWVGPGRSSGFPTLNVGTRARKSASSPRKNIFFTIARPTRLPGKYKLIWDGKDNHGKQLAGGDYTIFVEAAREHGTYQSIRQNVSLSDQPFRRDLKGNVEIRSASIEYRRKAAAK